MFSLQPPRHISTLHSADLPAASANVRFLGAMRTRRGPRGLGCFCRVGPGNFTPSPSQNHRTGLDTLASSGSCHRAKAAAFH